MDVLTKDEVAKLEREILEAFADDYVGLWEIAHDVEGDLGLEDPDIIREATMSIVRGMLLRGLIQPGMPMNNGTFKPWSMSPEQAADKMNRDWRVSGRPSLQDAWFDLTPAGEGYAERVGE